MIDDNLAAPNRRGRVIAAVIAVPALAIGAVQAWISQNRSRSGDGTAAAAPIPTAPGLPSLSTVAPLSTTVAPPPVAQSGPSLPDWSVGSSGSVDPTVGESSGGRSGAGGHLEPARVEATLRGPTTYRGGCPARLEYSATVAVRPATAELTYHWNDGTAWGGVDTVHVENGTATLRRSVTLSASGSGSMQLQVISPSPGSSNTRDFTVECVGDTADDASTAPNAHTGDCSPGITFTTTDAITVTNGPALVSYRWLRSDGSPSSVQTLTLVAGTSTQPVSDTWYQWTSAGARLGTVAGAEPSRSELQPLGLHHLLHVSRCVRLAAPCAICGRSSDIEKLS